jgi:hypothetical protein
MGVIERCVSVQLEEAGFTMSAGDVMLSASLELRAHGHPSESDGLALRAAEWFDRHAAGVDPESRGHWELWGHSAALLLVDRYEEARDLLVELSERRSPFWSLQGTGTLGMVAARTGDQVEARRVFNDLAEVDGREHSGLAAAHRASIAASLGKKDVAVELLRQAYSEGLPHGWWIHCDPNFEPLWDYPPFQELIAPKG